MTWFRVGGGSGIPAALKNRMNAVLNKKFGTAVDYPAEGWPDTVNLMGPLPEKTIVSSPVADFSDGADDVPTKSLVVTIAPTLSGTSSVTETQTGKNLLKITGSAVSGDLTVTPQTDGTVIVNGQRSTALTWNAGQFVAKGACSIVFSGCSGGSGSTYSVNIQKNNVYQADVYSGDSIAYNLVQGDVIKFIVVVRANVSMSNVVFSPMIRFSVVTDGTFEKYTETQYTASLGRTIYGGQGDIVNGTGQETHAKYSITGQEIGYYLAGTNNNGNRIDFPLAQAQTPLYTGGLSNIGENKACLNSATWTIGAWCVYSSRIYIVVPNEYTTFETALQYLVDNNATFVFPLATPTDFTFDGQEIPTKDGYNAFWSEQGNTALDYYGEPEPYTRGTASGAIANVQSARTDLPFTKVKANIAPNLTGVESVEVTKAGKNLIDASNATGTGTIWFYYDNGIKLKKDVTYTFSCGNYGSGSIAFYGIDHTTQVAYAYISSSSAKVTYTPTEDIIVCPRIYQVGLTVSDLVDVMLEVGSSASTYTPYEEPTVYTAELGEPVYGGYADLVSGTGMKICGKKTFNGSENWSAYTTGNGYAIPLTGMERGTWYTSPLALSYPLPKVPNNNNLGVRIGANNDGIYVVQANTIEGVTDLTSFKAWLAENPLTIIYPLDVTTEFTFDGQVISPSEGVNNLWNNVGGDIDVEYFEQE